MKAAKLPTWRVTTVLGTFAVFAAVLCWRSVDLQVLRNTAYQELGENTQLRTVVTPPHRGMITDRFGEPLAISTPVESVFANPKRLLVDDSGSQKIEALARVLGTDVGQLRAQLRERAKREFVFIKRRVSPRTAEQVRALGIDGVGLQREFRRFYPTGEVSAQILGFTGIDDNGLEGIELAYDSLLRGAPGSKRVRQNRRGDVIADVERITDVQEGRDVRLSIDRRVQYLAYRELKAAVLKHKAIGGSMVVLDVVTGEVLAMVNQPSFNPHAPPQRARGQTRNRAVTDVFEPGSTIKPFTVAAALDHGRISPQTVIDTTPGYMFVGRHRITDLHNYGRVDLTRLLQKSSNVAVAQLALKMDTPYLWDKFRALGFGAATQAGFPGEQSGVLNNYQKWRTIDQATVSYGYGLSTTTLQLARAYLAFADDGRIKAVSLRPSTGDSAFVQVFKPSTARRVRKMMESVVTDEGTAATARIPFYKVAGKTGTVRKNTGGTYSGDRHMALFAGIVPAGRPRLVAVVVIDEPKGKEYYGGSVAAPVFATVMGGALRLLDIPPDDLQPRTVQLASTEKSTRTP